MARADENNDEAGEQERPNSEEDRSADLAVNYESLWYIKLRGEDDKLPLETWGGYEQNFAEADTVYSHEGVMASSHDWWAVVGYQDNNPHLRRETFMLDLDTYKAEDPEAAVEDMTVGSNTLITRSQSGGNHVWFTVTADKGSFKESDFELHEDLEFDIDIRGSAVSHHVVAPNDIPGIDGSYEIVNDDSVKNHLTVERACEQVTVSGESAVTHNPNRGFNGDVDVDIVGYTPEDGNEWLLESDVRNALESVSADLGYAEWRDVGFAVADYYARVGGDREDAVETIVEWSEAAPDAFDNETERHAFNIVQSGFESAENDDSDRVTLGTLLSVAAANGWEWPDVRERKAYGKAREFIDEWPEVEDRSDDFDEDEFEDAENRIANALIHLNSDHFNDVIEDVIARVNTSEDRVRNHRSIGRSVEERGSEAFHAGGELVSATKPKESAWYVTTTLLNFRLDVDSVLDVEGESRMAQVHVTPTEPNESEFDLEIEPRTFNDSRRFKDTVLAERFSTVIEAPMHDNDVMDLIRQYIASLDVPTRYGQYGMGLSGDGSEFVTPTGTITPDGWTDDPENVHVERGSKTNSTVRAFSANPDEHDDINPSDVARMIELVSQSRAPDRMAALLGWFYAAPHRRRIVDATTQFNPMAVTGRSGSGKTATVAALNQMWGMSTEPQSAEASKHAVLTGFASSRGVPVWFDEYRPEKIGGYVLDRFHAFYKKAATGGVEPRGNQSMGTDDWHLRSPIVVTGESEIRANAERRRTVNVTVTKKPTKDGPQKQAFKDLVGDVTTDDDDNVQFPDANHNLQEHAVAYYSHVAGVSGDEFKDAWFGARERVAELVSKWGDDVDLGDMEIQALQTVVFGYRQMVVFAQTVGADLSTLPTTDDLEAALAHIADVDGDGRQPHEHQFMSLVSRAAAADYMEADTDFTVVHEGKSNEDLRVNVTRAFDKVSKFVRDHDLNEDLLQSATDYKKRFQQLENEDTFVTTTSQNTPPISRCTGIDMERAVEDVGGFARESFTDVREDAAEVVIEDAGDDDNDSDGDDDGLTKVDELDPENTDTGFETVTVRATKWDTSDESPLPLTGTVKDKSGAVSVVSFDAIAAPVDEDDYIRIMDAVVDDYDGKTQLRIERGTTEIEPIQPGVGMTEPVASPDEQEMVNDADSNNDDGDGDDNMNTAVTAEEVTGLEHEMDEIVNVINDSDGGVESLEDAKTEAATRLGDSDGDLDAAVTALKKKGKLYESGDMWRCT